MRPEWCNRVGRPVSPRSISSSSVRLSVARRGKSAAVAWRVVWSAQLVLRRGAARQQRSKQPGIRVVRQHQVRTSCGSELRNLPKKDLSSCSGQVVALKTAVLKQPGWSTVWQTVRKWVPHLSILSSSSDVSSSLCLATGAGHVEKKSGKRLCSSIDPISRLTFHKFKHLTSSMPRRSRRFLAAARRSVSRRSSGSSPKITAARSASPTGETKKHPQGCRTKKIEAGLEMKQEKHVF